MKPAARAVLIAAGVTALASCKSTTTTPDATSPDAIPPPGTATYWIAPNGSDVDLKLVTAQPPPGQ